MRLVHAALLLAVTASPAFAQREPVIVIPGKPGVPVYINGIDASWGVVEGEFGLDRPGPGGADRDLSAARGRDAGERSGLPSDDRQAPRLWPLEIVPPANRPMPPPAPTYYRSWSSGSAPGPVTDYPSYPMPPVVGRRRISATGGETDPKPTGQGSVTSSGRPRSGLSPSASSSRPASKGVSCRSIALSSWPSPHCSQSA